MEKNPACTVYIGNLDEKVSERVLYEILIQVGRVVDLYIPRDKETNRHKSYAFAEYETEEIADYAVRLFSGLVCLHNKTLKFAVSGRDKSSQNGTQFPQSSIPPLPNNGPSQSYERQLSQAYARSVIDGMGSPSSYSVSPVYPRASPHGSSNGLSTSNYEYSRRVLGSVLNVSRPTDRHPLVYPFY